MIYPNKPLYLLSLLGYIYYLTYYTLTTKDNIVLTSVMDIITDCGDGGKQRSVAREGDLPIYFSLIIF